MTMTMFNLTMIMIMIFLLFLGCSVCFVNSKSATLLNLSVIGGIVSILGILVVIFLPSDEVEIDRMSIAAESIDAYDINDKQQYKITIDDGTVYDTEYWFLNENEVHVFVEESDDNEFHLYNITYQKQSKIGSLILTNGETIEWILEVPHEYYALHTKEQDNNMTRVYTNNE